MSNSLVASAVIASPSLLQSIPSHPYDKIAKPLLVITYVCWAFQSILKACLWKDGNGILVDDSCLPS